ncbi:MAG: glycosyltransferase [Bacteroidaceae bacterium]|nr:glycosyltransferase [Bacteroidaceae bacterium]
MTALVIIDYVLFVTIAVSVAYVAIFAFASLLPRCRAHRNEEARPNFLVIIPAYKEDNVILDTVEATLRQDWPLFTLCVAADSMSEQTMSHLKSLPLALAVNNSDIHTKAHALKLAMLTVFDPTVHTHVVIIDADNIIQPSTLTRLAPYCTHDTVAIQAHRCAKNTNTPIAILDAVSEEINNSVFRLGHNNLGLSSALIGSGMCFKASWFDQAVKHIETVGEDKELERMLLLDKQHITYLPDIYVLDEKVSDSQNFGLQRRRWLAAQFVNLKQMLTFLPSALRHANLDYIDKTLQQALIPRSLLIALTVLLTAVTTLLQLTLRHYDGAAKWWVMTSVLLIALLCAVPRRLYNRQLLQALLSLPLLILRMAGSLFHLRGASSTFLHTQHGTNNK